MTYGLLTGAARAGVPASAVAPPIAVALIAFAALTAIAWAGGFLWHYGSPASALVATYFGGCMGVAFWSLRSETLGKVIATFGLPALIGVQLFRVVGGSLVLAHHAGWVPDYFALTVGWGDTIAGLTAPIVAAVAWFRPRGVVVRGRRVDGLRDRRPDALGRRRDAERRHAVPHTSGAPAAARRVPDGAVDRVPRADRALVLLATGRRLREEAPWTR